MTRPCRAAAVRSATLAVALAFGAVSAASPIVVDPSAESEPYQKALAGIREQLATRGMADRVVVAQGNGPEDAAARVALGQAAAARLDRAPAGAARVACLVLDPASSPSARAVVHLRLEPAEQVRVIRSVLGPNRPVGFLYGSEDNVPIAAAAVRAGAEAGVEVVPMRVTGPSEIPRALEELARRTQALWIPADPVVAAPESAQGILLFAFKKKLPVFGPSLPWAKAGALVAFERDYRDVGRQCADALLQALDGSGSTPPVPRGPRRLLHAVNLRTAREIGVDLPETTVAGAFQVFR